MSSTIEPRGATGTGVGTHTDKPAGRAHTVPLLLGLTRFAHRVPALVPVVLFLAVVWADFGAGLNIPALFWHEPFDEYGHGQWGYGLVNGLSVTLLFAYLWAVTFVLDATFNPDTVSGKGDSWPARFVGALYPVAPTATDEAKQFRYYMGVTFAPCVLALALATALQVNGEPPFVHTFTTDKFAERQVPLIEQRWPILVGVLVGLLAIRALQWIGSYLARGEFALVRIGRIVRKVFVTRRETEWLRNMIEAVFAAQLFLFVGLALATLAGWYAPPVLAACVLFGLIAGVFSWVWYQARGWALPAFAGLAVWLAVANLPDHKVRFPELDYSNPVGLRDREHPEDEWTGPADWTRAARNLEARLDRLAPGTRADEIRARLAALAPDKANYRKLLDLYDEVSKAQIDEEVALLHTWAAGAPKPKGLPKLVIVTVTGGANRSALWTTTVLDKLHNAPGLPGFAKHVRLITGASGGMVGAAHYVGSLEEGGALPADYDPDDVAQHHIFPIASSLVLKEVPFFGLPLRYDWDRGQALDRSLEGEGRHIAAAARARLARSFARPVRDLDAGERAGWRPSLVFTPMLIEDGRRLVISNRAVPYLTRSTGASLFSGAAVRPVEAKQDARGGKPHVPNVAPGAADDADDVYSYSGIEFFHLFPPTPGAPGARFRLSTAARMNATFPFVSPAVELPTVPPRRVVDAGYYDNYGVGAAAAWVHFWRRWLRDNTSGVLIVQIRDSASQYDRRHLVLQSEPETNGNGGSAWEWLTGPLEAVDRARQATASYRNDEQLAVSDETFNRSKGGGFFQTVVFERYTNVGMSWYLNSDDKRQIRGSWDYATNREALRVMVEWWRTH